MDLQADPAPSSTEPSCDQQSPPELVLSVRLDRPFHEIKQSLLAEFERVYVQRVLAESALNISMASRSSGVSRKHLRTLISKYSIIVR
jgi:DNA-binding NtrC family response regulator